MEKINTLNKSTVTSEPHPTNSDTTGENSSRFVVVRDGHRVSDKEYEASNNPACIDEVKFWKKIAGKGASEKVEVVRYDSKKHRIWYGESNDS